MGLSRRLLIFFIVVLSIFGPLSTDMYLSGLPEMMNLFGTTEAVMSITLYGFMLSLAISVLLLGPISDKYGRRPVIIASMALYTVMSIACALTSDVYVLIVLRVVQAIGAGGALAVSVALIKDCFTGTDRKNTLAITAALGVIGPIAAPILGTALIQAFDWRATFWAPAIVSSFCLLLSLMLQESLHDDERYNGPIAGALKGLVKVLKDLNFTRFTIMMTIYSAPLLAYLAVSSYIYQEYYGISQTGYSLILAATMVFGLIGMFVLQAVNRRVGNVRMVSVILALSLVSCILMLTIGYSGEYLFLLSMVPSAMVTMFVRPYGFEILMNQHDGDNGSVSSVLNFGTFAFGCIGMLLASLPWPNFITGIGFCIGLCCVVYVIMWLRVRMSGSTLKGLEV